eukprot:TRINITY_DN5854_c0_g2_i5.p2 TRINITY_DN5854_c0_g2~~TRINITY_DN5854_c0_g2_i5.p2  ORF type:complete len:103 (-),score=13.76 TRINITY_DN5854_c0_g2_i5:164-472(-)
MHLSLEVLRLRETCGCNVHAFASSTAFLLFFISVCSFCVFLASMRRSARERLDALLPLTSLASCFLLSLDLSANLTELGFSCGVWEYCGMLFDAVVCVILFK